MTTLQVAHERELNLHALDRIGSQDHLTSFASFFNRIEAVCRGGRADVLQNFQRCRTVRRSQQELLKVRPAVLSIQDGHAQ